MPMAKFNVLFWMFYIKSLQIIPVVPQIQKMYEIDLRTTCPTRYDFYIKNFNSSNIYIPIMVEIKSSQSNIQRFVCIHFNRATNTYIKNLYYFLKDLTETNQIFYKFSFTTALGKNNILKTHIPTLKSKESLGSPHDTLIKKKTENISDIRLKIQNSFAEFVLFNKIETTLLSRQLLNDLTSKTVSKVVHSLESKDYILSFFERDYSKIINFLKEFVSLLQEDNELLQYKLPIFFINFMRNNSNNFWKNELMLSDINFYTFKDIHLFTCFFTDLKNLFCLIKNPDYKFELNDYDQYIGTLCGNPSVAISIHFEEDIDEKNLKCFVCNKKKNELSFKLMIDSKKRTVFLMFDLRYLKESNITQLDCIVQTPNKHYQSCNIDLKNYLK